MPKLNDRTGLEANLGYLNISLNPHWWSFTWHTKCWIGVFRNSPEVIPGRWGFYFFGIEFGSRDPGDRVGVWLKNHYLWPW